MCVGDGRRVFAEPSLRKNWKGKYERRPSWKILNGIIREVADDRLGVEWIGTNRESNIH